MFKNIAILAFSILFYSELSNAMVVKDLISPRAQKIILPCAAGIAVSQLLGQELGVGLAICAASSTYVYVSDLHNPNQDKTKQDIDMFLKESDKQFKEALLKHKEEYGIYQDAVRKVILDKLSELQGASETQIEKYMQSPSFEVFLKKKTQEIVLSSDDVVTERLEKAKEEIRKAITEEVLKDVVDARVSE